jgi:predicted RecB family nuclease
MAVTVNLDAVLTPDFQNSSVTDLVNAPTTALSGISPEQADGLRLAFGIETIADLADNTFVRAAIAIREMAKVAQ